jgi:membrane protease YdiL (CAAX protease family)
MAQATWSPLVAWLGGLGIFLAASIVAVVPAAFGSLEDPAPIATFFSVLVQDIAIVSGVWLVVHSTSTSDVWRSLGLRSTRFWPALGIGLLAYLALLAFSGAWDQVVNSPPEDLLDEVGAGQSLLASIAICLAVCVIAPLAEETLFRGFIFGGLRGWKGFWPAALISGAMFGAAHAFGSPVEFLVPLALFGFLLAVVYELTKSLYPGIYLHAFNNSIAFSVGLSLGWETVLVFAGSFVAITVALITVRRMA